jgi:hypothetical protein
MARSGAGESRGAAGGGQNSRRVTVAPRSAEIEVGAPGR